MGRRELRDSQPGFSGLNATADEAHLGPSDMRRAENAKLTEYLAVKKRLGTQRTHSSAIGSPSIVRGGFSWEQPASTVQLAVANGTLYTGTYSIGMTWTSQAGALDASAYPSFAHFRDGSAEVVYIADGGLLNKWDGTTLTVNIASTPSAKRVWVYNQRLFGVTGTDQTLYWSALNNGDTLGITGSSGGSAVVRTFGNQALTGGIALGDTNLLFHRTGVSRFTGWTQDDISIATGTRGVSTQTGTIAPRTIVVAENDEGVAEFCYFLSDSGVYRASEGGVQNVSGPIQSIIASLDQSLYERASAVHHKAAQSILFYFPDLGVYAYNYRVAQMGGTGWTGPWNGAYTSATVYSLWSARDASSKPIVLWGGGDGFIRRAEMPSIYKDDVVSAGTGGSAFTLVAKCRRFFFKAPSIEKSLRRLWVTASPHGSETAGVEWQMATASGSGSIPCGCGSTWGSFTWGTDSWGGSGTDTYPIQAHGRGRYLDVTITDDGEAEGTYARVEASAYDMSERP